VLGLYIAACASGAAGPRSCSVGAIERRLSALMWNFAQRGQPMDRKDWHVATVLAGIRRTKGRPPEQKEAILPEDLLAMIATLDLGDLRGLRDRAILLVGFAGGLRRSEIVGLDCRREDGLSGGWIEFFDDGLLLTLRGKTGWREVEIGRGSPDVTCPVAALETWLKFARISVGPAFHRVVGGKAGAERLTDRHVARLVKPPPWPPACAATRRRASGRGSSPAIRCAPASPPRPRSTNATCKSSSATPPPK
jgi:integrase